MEPTTLRNPEQITATPLESVFTWTLFLGAPLSAESWRFPESAPFGWTVGPGELGKVAIADSRIEPPRMPRFVKEMRGLGPRQHDERLIKAVLVPPSLRICAFAPWRETILCAISRQGAKAQWKTRRGMVPVRVIAQAVQNVQFAGVCGLLFSTATSIINRSVGTAAVRPRCRPKRS